MGDGDIDPTSRWRSPQAYTVRLPRLSLTKVTSLALLHPVTSITPPRGPRVVRSTNAVTRERLQSVNLQVPEGDFNAAISPVLSPVLTYFDYFVSFALTDAYAPAMGARLRIQSGGFYVYKVPFVWSSSRSTLGTEIGK